MTDSDFNPTDAEGLAAWFARAEANAAGLRRRLDDLGGEWRNPPPEPAPRTRDSTLRIDPAVRRTDPAATHYPPRERPLLRPYGAAAGACAEGGMLDQRYA